MAERLDEVHVVVNRHNDEFGNPHVNITTDRILTSEKSFHPERFEDVRAKLDDLSKGAYAWAAASLLAIGLSLDQAVRTIEDSPQRPLHTAIALLAANAAYYWGNNAKRDWEHREIEVLEAKTYQEAMRTTNSEYEATFPVGIEERFKVAIGTLQADGINPTIEQVIERDRSLRSSKKNAASEAGSNEATDTITSLVNQGYINSREVTDHKSDPKNPVKKTIYFVPDIDEEV